MFFPPSFLDELRNRLNISTIVSRYVRLHQKAGGEYTGLCPFHNEKTPSFTVSDKKGFYHCFGCGAHGDVVRFLTEHRGLDFPEAIKQLAEEAGLPLPQQDPQQQKRYEKLLTLYDVMEMACQYFQEQLQLSGGQSARDYLGKRRLSSQTIQTFRLGYAPTSRNTLKEALLKKNCTERQLLDCGLIIKPDDGRESYDRFRNRLMFPIMDVKGRIIAFGGRILGDGQPKYLNSPDTDLFHKGKILYNFHQARDVAFKKGHIAMVEGYMDVIALHQAGITNTVAPLGTAITEDQLSHCWKVADTPVMCLDGDNAGQRAMTRAAELSLPLLQPGKSLSFVTLPKGKDPDDVVTHDGVDIMRQMLSQPIPLSEALWQIQQRLGKLDTPEQQAALKQRLSSMTQRISDGTVREYYQKYFNNKLWELSRHRPTGKTETSRSSLTAITISRRQRYEAILLITLINHPALLDDPDIAEELVHVDIQHPPFYELRKLLLSFADHSGTEQSVNDVLSYIKKNEQYQTLDYIKQHFPLDVFSRENVPNEQAMAGWQYILACHRLESISEEYNQSAHSSTEQQWELKKHKDELEMLTEQKKLYYEEQYSD